LPTGLSVRIANNKEGGMSETAELFRAGLERLAGGDLGGYLDLCSEDVEVEFPFAPPGRPQRVRGREDLRRYLEPLLARAAYDEISDLVVYETDVAGTIVAEMTIGLRMGGLKRSAQRILTASRMVSCSQGSSAADR
jgi:hypothetical protein